MYRLRISNRAKKEIKAIARIHQTAIIEALQELREEPFVGKPLTRAFTGRFSFRVGMYRIIYQVNRKDNIVSILSAGHRLHVYKS